MLAVLLTGSPEGWNFPWASSSIWTCRGGGNVHEGQQRSCRSHCRLLTNLGLEEPELLVLLKQQLVGVKRPPLVPEGI